VSDRGVLWCWERVLLVRLQLLCARMASSPLSFSARESCVCIRIDWQPLSIWCLLITSSMLRWCSDGRQWHLGSSFASTQQQQHAATSTRSLNPLNHCRSTLLLQFVWFIVDWQPLILWDLPTFSIGS
jgi:hypothetical protein